LGAYIPRLLPDGRHPDGCNLLQIYSLGGDSCVGAAAELTQSDSLRTIGCAGFVPVGGGAVLVGKWINSALASTPKSRFSGKPESDAFH